MIQLTTNEVVIASVPPQLWLLDVAVYVAAAVAWVVVLYIAYRTVGYVQEEFLGLNEPQTDGARTESLNE